LCSKWPRLENPNVHSGPRLGIFPSFVLSELGRILFVVLLYRLEVV
jgi:hypothetical protein